MFIYAITVEVVYDRMPPHLIPALRKESFVGMSRSPQAARRIARAKFRACKATRIKTRFADRMTAPNGVVSHYIDHSTGWLVM